MTMLTSDKLTPQQEIAAAFAEELGGTAPTSHIKSRPDGEYIIFEVAKPNNRLYAALERANKSLPTDHPFRDRNSLATRHRKPNNALDIPETKILQRELSESLTVDRHTFGDDYLSRYMESVSNLEQSIVGNANYIVYGRRGSGKSSLLAYALHSLRKLGYPSSWVAMQTYSGRSDNQAVANVLLESLNEASNYVESKVEFTKVTGALEQLVDGSDPDIAHRIDKLLPKLRELLGSLATRKRPFTIFLDDIHVLSAALQPQLLATIYSVSRGNNIYIKASGIEQLTKPWDAKTRKGLESPHDAQVLKLDLNLTMPDRSEKHILSILDAHARYCGLPSVYYVAGEQVISRLVLAAAAVPRDALSLFSQAITKSVVKGQKAVSVTSVNAAASEAIEEKLKDVGKDLPAAGDDLMTFLERVKQFCVGQHRTNAFLVRINNASVGFAKIQNLTALRFVHVLHEGITPHKAGERFVALMLDFGFYIGIRAAKSVVLVPDRPRQLLAKELRQLPIFDPDQL
jgi:hypothetical protein